MPRPIHCLPTLRPTALAALLAESDQVRDPAPGVRLG